MRNRLRKLGRVARRTPGALRNAASAFKASLSGSPKL